MKIGKDKAKIIQLTTSVVTEAGEAMHQQLEAANLQLIFQNDEKEKRAAELIIANEELALQNKHKEKLAEELIIANIELVYQNGEKEKRAAELVIANKELAFQNENKEKLAEELIIANIELVYQNGEKEKRAAELVIANKELAFQNENKEKLAEELIIANIELVYQNGEKEKRAAELIIANKELAFQNEEKEKRASELLFANKEIQTFTFISSHDLQEPLRKIQLFSGMVLDKEAGNLSANSVDYLKRTQSAALRMQLLIESLLVYSHSNLSEQVFETVSLDELCNEVKKEHAEMIFEKKATIIYSNLGQAVVSISQFRLLLSHLLNNSLKFSRPDLAPQITITTKTASGSFLLKENAGFSGKELLPRKKYLHIRFADNGIGFDEIYKDKIFEIFQQLHSKEKYEGAGIGLPIVKKIVANHGGLITATGNLDKGAVFDIYLPVSA